MVNTKKKGAKIKWGAMPTCYYLTFSHVFPTFSVFKVVHHEHPFAFSPSAISVLPLSEEHILG